MITAVVLAAGESKRMGRPKLPMPWGRLTVLQQVIDALRAGGVEDILVVTGGARKQIEEICLKEAVRTVHNPDYASNEMLGSLQIGLGVLTGDVEAGLVTLGDQPQIEAATVRALLAEYGREKSELIVPSHQKRRGHPWLIGRSYWSEILEMKAPDSPREFLRWHADEIRYVEIDSPTILQDLDTPEDYKRARPGN